MQQDWSFEKEIEKVLKNNHFFFTRHGNAVKELCNKKHIYVSIVTYKQSLDEWDKRYNEKTGITDSTKKVYWMQFRNNTGGKFYFVDDWCYVTSPTQLQSLLNAWRKHYRIAVKGMQQRYEDEGRDAQFG